MHVPIDVLGQPQAGSAAMVMLQKVAGTFWLTELQSVRTVQHHFRTSYRHEPRTCIHIWLWDYKLKTAGGQLCEKGNLSCQWSYEWALLQDLGK
jgi:hypothetical protein